MIYTIGHSTRSADAFLDLLRANHIRQLADVRTVPRSRRHPHFSGDVLDLFLRSHDIGYRHFPELGGFRPPRPDSTNTAWQNASFRGYADYMQTPLFREGLRALLQFAGDHRTAVMCAEAAWWRCHRRLLADALVVGGTPVLHILSPSRPKPHEVSEFARIDGGLVTYPGLL